MSSGYTMRFPRDVRAFLDGYPGVEDDPEASANWEFYSNARRCQPDNHLIDEIHERWFGDYHKLEHKHGFIQWLFPIREYGMNYESRPLQPHEVDMMKANARIMGRVVRSYKLMLDFYGMRLMSERTGLLSRVESPRSYEAQYHNLLASPHNFLRISRILKCLSELGLERLNTGFLLYVLNEQSEFGQLNSGGLQTSMDRWWSNCLRGSDERVWVREAIKRVRKGGGFVFTRAMYEKALLNREKSGSLGSLQE